MNGQFFAGCAAGGLIALAMILLAVWGANRGNGNIAKKNREANDLSAKLLEARNSIGERQMFAINELVYGKAARRERIATAVLCGFCGDNAHMESSEPSLAAAAIRQADWLITELDRKPEQSDSDG